MSNEKLVKQLQNILQLAKNGGDGGAYWHFADQYETFCVRTQKDTIPEDLESHLRDFLVHCIEAEAAITTTLHRIVQGGDACENEKIKSIMKKLETPEDRVCYTLHAGERRQEIQYAISVAKQLLSDNCNN
ncbi:MAG: hypothetical protein LBH00_05135 [Planctomycetaceae bacterium]|jgi:hypothetical protein|nr:hypothetical protein [Planctomycetaceae bacterium]